MKIININGIINYWKVFKCENKEKKKKGKGVLDPWISISSSEF